MIQDDISPEAVGQSGPPINRTGSKILKSEHLFGILIRREKNRNILHSLKWNNHHFPFHPPFLVARVMILLENENCEIS